MIGWTWSRKIDDDMIEIVKIADTDVPDKDVNLIGVRSVPMTLQYMND